MHVAHGDPDKVIVESVPKPFPVPGTVVVKVHVSAVNPVDFKVLKGSRWGKRRRNSVDQNISLSIIDSRTKLSVLSWV